jgi:L-2-hydroxycarboxylate dehydrogenase (NAD+)
MTMRVDAERLLAFTREVFVAAGVPAEDAGVVADALVTTDLRGVDSHGVAHLSRYVHGLHNGSPKARPQIRVLRETPSTALWDADRGLGFVIGYRAMQAAIEKARAVGSGWVVARNSTHYGAAGYYAGLALEHGMIGVSLCTSKARMAPTNGARGMVGTNPIAIAVPTGVEPAFLLDMSTCVVPMGRLEVYARQGRPLPAGWVIDTSGQPITDPGRALRIMQGEEACLLPLGGAGETTSGYKGYGLGVAVEILCNLLGGYDGEIPLETGHESPVAQFFGALSVEAFRPLAEFAAAMDKRLREFKATPRLPGAGCVLVAGQKEYETMQERRARGIPLDDLVVKELTALGRLLGVALPWE